MSWEQVHLKRTFYTLWEQLIFQVTWRMTYRFHTISKFLFVPAVRLCFRASHVQLTSSGSFMLKPDCLLISFLYTPSGFESSSLCSPHSIILPWSTTATRLAFFTVDRRWAMTSTVLPSASRSSASCTRCSFSASSALRPEAAQERCQCPACVHPCAPFPTVASCCNWALLGFPSMFCVLTVT